MHVSRAHSSCCLFIRSLSVLKLKVENNWGHRQYAHLPRDGYLVVWRERPGLSAFGCAVRRRHTSCQVLGGTTLFSGIGTIFCRKFHAFNELVAVTCIWVLFNMCCCYLAREFGNCFIYFHDQQVKSQTYSTL